MTLLRLDYLVHALGNCVDDTPTETGLKLWKAQVQDLDLSCLIRYLFSIEIKSPTKQKHI